MRTTLQTPQQHTSEMIVNVDSLTAVLSPVLEQHGLELDRLEVVPAGRRSVLRITVDGDGPAGRGPLLDDIAVASTALSAALDGSAVVADHPYTLEVSSRGVGRPLTEAKHFRRNTGRLVLVSTADGRQVEGRIVEVSEPSDATEPVVILEVTGAPPAKGRRPTTVAQKLPLSQISKAVVRIEMNRPLQAGLDDVVVSPDSAEDDDGLDDDDLVEDDLDEDDLDDEQRDDEED